MKVRPAPSIHDIEAAAAEEEEEEEKEHVRRSVFVPIKPGAHFELAEGELAEESSEEEVVHEKGKETPKSAKSTATEKTVIEVVSVCTTPVPLKGCLTELQ